MKTRKCFGMGVILILGIDNIDRENIFGDFEEVYKMRLPEHELIMIIKVFDEVFSSEKVEHIIYV